MKRERTALVLIAACVSSSGACNGGVPSSFEREASRVEGALIGASTAKLLERPAATRNKLRIVQPWRLLVSEPWQVYAQAVEASLVPSYNCSQRDRALSCARWLPGDLLQLSVDAEHAADGLVVRAQLHATPD